MSSIKRIKDVPRLPTRQADAHKGSFGRVLVVGGSVGMAGAPSLAGNSALRSGAGLVTLALPEPILNVVAGLCPCATTLVLTANKSGQIKPVAAIKEMRSRGWIGGQSEANPPGALVVGPGIGTGSHANAENWWELIDAFRIRSGVPVVIDADALNLAALLPNGWDGRPHPRTIITPHPGELARMMKVSIRDIQAHREEVALEAARRLNAHTDAADRAVVLLKGAGTVVTDGESLYINQTGNPGMATGGSGDVLAGILGALLCQGLSCLDAAVLGAHVHGHAGDLAAQRFGQVSLIATDLIESLPEAFRSPPAKDRRPKRSKEKRR